MSGDAPTGEVAEVCVNEWLAIKAPNTTVIDGVKIFMTSILPAIDVEWQVPNESGKER